RVEKPRHSQPVSKELEEKMSNEVKTYRYTLDGQEIEMTFGKYAGQANSSVLVQCGGTAVLVMATMSKKPREGIDFFPLVVDYEEKLYAVGRVPGSFLRREGRGSENAIL